MKTHKFHKKSWLISHCWHTKIFHVS